jgi:D-threo-aldose 1-dehydrogenase
LTARLGLGAAPLGNLYSVISDEAAAATVDAAWAAGIRYFDTAPLYGSGLSETRLGRALAGRPRDQYEISTKVGRVLEPGADPDSIFVGIPASRPRFDFSRDGIMRSFEASLDRLGLDRVDTLLLHDPDDHEDQARSEALPALIELRQSGAVSSIGAGMNQTAMLSRFVSHFDLDRVLVAGRWSLLDRSAGEVLLPLCAERGVEVIVGGVFNSGLLADPEGAAPFDYGRAPQAMVEGARAMAEAAARRGVSLVAPAVQFPARHPAVGVVLVGVRSVQEVVANAGAFGAEVPVELWPELEACRPTA